MDAYIKAISYYLPEREFTNEELIAEFPEWNVEKVSAKTGILKRHIAGESETAADMAVKAAEKLFSEHGIQPADIDFILFCTQSPDYFLPTSACIIQDRLGIPVKSGALDFNLGCSGYAYGLSLAAGLLKSQSANHILLLTAETYSKYIHQKDKGNRSLFGDGAAATLVSASGFARIVNFVFGTDGRGAENLIVKNGGARQKCPAGDDMVDEYGLIHSSDHLFMDGSKIFNFTLSVVPELVNDILAKNSMRKDEVDYFLFHQANKFMLDTIRKICKIDKSKYYMNLENTGNTVSSTLPIAIADAMNGKHILPDFKVMIAGFGVGYSWSGTMLYF